MSVSLEEGPYETGIQPSEEEAQLASAGVSEGLQWAGSAGAEKLQTEFSCRHGKALLPG